MRLLFCRTLASLFIITCFVMTVSNFEQARDPDGLLSVLLREISSRPAYAKKDKNNDREARRAARKAQEQSFKESSSKEWTSSGSNSSSGLNSSGSLKSSGSSSFSGSSKSDASSFAPTTPAKADSNSDPVTKSTTSVKGNSNPGKSNNSGDDDDDSDPDAPAATVKDFFEKAAQPPRKRRPTAPSIEAIDHDPQSIGNRGNDILVQGLNNEQIKQATADLKLVPVETTNVPSLGVNVTRFKVPGNMGRNIARELVRERFGISGFPENHTYVIWAPMDGAIQYAPDVVPDAGTRTGQCRDDRCIGRAAICWSEDMAARAKSVKIGIIDTAIDRDHPAFAGRRISTGTFLNGHARTQFDWHGTAVLSLLAGDMQSGIPGLAPDAEFFVAETFRTDEQGNATTDTASILKALAWLDSQQVHIINMSFSGPRDVLVEQAIQRMRANGVTFVAAAGNFGPTAAPSYPAAYKEVIAVTAITKDGNNYPSANRGDYVDLAAPGVRIWTAIPGGKEGFRTGTSFAAPFVTGILAAKLSSGPTHNAEADDLRLVKTFDLGPPGIDPIFGRGLAVASTACHANMAASPPPSTASVSTPDAPPPATPSFGQMTIVPAGAAAFSP